MRSISVVLPVYNESESIAACLRGLDAALRSEEHEILVCYDTEEDSTLPEIAAMPDRPANVKLVRNTLGRGALNAIRTGFAAARGDVVVTSMADLSDPPEVILGMAKRIRAGADVVSGSRYMRGGSQTGGPWLKRTLSRIAGLSLRWIAGIGTHDATSNFRGYSKAFLDTVTVESRGGFEIALELTVKAHLAGRVVAEVPSSWVDRSAGSSNFRMWRWMPNYLGWYLRAMGAPLVVLGVWLAMVLSAVHLVAAYATSVPFKDDYSIVDGLSRGPQRLLDWLWTLHNEHRVPIAKLAGWASVKLAQDFRAPMILQVGLLAAAALGSILAVRRIRGRTSAADAFFPLVFLNWGHFENLLCAFQIALVLPAVLAATIAALVAGSTPEPDRRRATWIGLGIAALPLCSAAGLIQAIPLLLWAGWAGATTWRSRGLQRGGAGLALLLGSAAAALLAALYFVDYVRPGQNEVTVDPASVPTHALYLLARGAGPLDDPATAVVRVIVVVLGLATLAAGAARIRAHPEERRRELGLLACGAGSVALALAIALGRGASPGALAAPRYVTLFAPFLALIYFAWSHYGNEIGRRIVHVGLCLGIAVLIPGTVDQVRAYAAGRLRGAQLLVRDADAGLDPETLSARHWKEFESDEDRFADRLEILRHLGLPPYREPVEGPIVDPRVSRPFAVWKSQPIEVRSDQPVVRRRFMGARAVLVHASTELIFDVPPAAHGVRIGFGIDPTLYSKPRDNTKGVRFRLERVERDGGRSVLFERVLDPVDRAGDRGIQSSAIPLPESSAHRIALSVASVEGGNPSRDWGFWTGVDIE